MRNEMKIRKRIVNEVQTDLMQTYGDLGDIYRQMGNVDSSLTYLNRAIRLAEELERKVNPTEPKAAAAIVLNYYKSKALLYFADTIKENKVNSLQESLVNFEKVFEIIESKRKSLGSQEISKIALLKENFQSYSLAISAAHQLFDITKKQQYLSLVFQLAEKGKAALLEENLQESGAKKFANIPPKIIEKKN